MVAHRCRIFLRPCLQPALFETAANCSILEPSSSQSSLFQFPTPPAIHSLPPMNLRPKMLLVFATTVVGGMGILYFLSRDLLLSSFRHLETEQMNQNLDYSLAALSQEYDAVGRTTNDYAYWDRTYEFAKHPENA